MVSSSQAKPIADRLNQIQQTLPASVRLIAVSKQVSTEAIRLAYEAGVRDFGESRIQEVAEKQAALHDLADITWHLIGHLQSNKAARALDYFQWIHSIDSLKLAEKLNQLAIDRPVKPNVLLQVKTVT
ncbi:MAG: YggS family pyridoxal phosphate-dependent enzyme, partial [Leptolyngbyaceae cyanobacterium SL_7_1]|nr:YggS family pyridoxal phosphate-dependent enzyme [Leptolyngbyaceae cyanobacterium SL_7_1]